MGAMRVGVTIRNPADQSRSWQGTFLVDTGATDTVVPPECVDAIGLEPRAQRTYELADGRSVRMNVACADIEFLDDYVAGLVVFGEPGTEPLLGTTALASMGVEVNPRNSELRKLPAVRLKAVTGSRPLTFSQAHGYEPLPELLQLETLPREARTRIMNVLTQLAGSYTELDYSYNLVEPLLDISKDVHTDHYVHLLVEWDQSLDHFQSMVETTIMSEPFHKVFDLLQYILGHPRCPGTLIAEMKTAFGDSRLAYCIDDTGPPTIIPTVTAEEGRAIASSLEQLADAGLDGSASHLRKSAECINRREWADSIRESIHAVESVAMKIDPTAQGLKAALQSLGDRVELHPAFKQAILKLYGYSSDEKGIRHALLEGDNARVDVDEAVFMLGACASFASYLWRKHSAT